MADSLEDDKWIVIAEEDARAAEVLFGTDRQAFKGAICFHCQQAAEKYLKACLVRRGIKFPKTHDLEHLLQLCKRLSEGFDRLGEAAARLQPYAVNARYGVAPRGAGTVDQALGHMHAVRNFCRAFFEPNNP